MNIPTGYAIHIKSIILVVLLQTSCLIELDFIKKLQAAGNSFS